MRRRIIGALAVAALCAPGTWTRADVSRTPPKSITLTEVAGPAAIDAPGWALEGIWQYRAESLFFGGFSAMLTLGQGRLRAFSDRGTRFTLVEPDQPQPEKRPQDKHNPARNVVRQLVEPGLANELWDIESATRDPETGQYWLGYEYVHAIHRFTIASEMAGVRKLSESEVDWTSNTGVEAMERLDDGRFVLLPEGRREGLIFAGDPLSGDAPRVFAYRPAIDGFATTDMKQLPDGRILVLMRNLDWGVGGWPPFESQLAIGSPPRAGAEEPWYPQITLNLADIVPRENYEGLAVRERTDGTLDVWLISDDNFSALQRTLLVKLRFDPAAYDAAVTETAAPTNAVQTKQKARE